MQRELLEQIEPLESLELPRSKVHAPSISSGGTYWEHIRTHGWLSVRVSLYRGGLWKWDNLLGSQEFDPWGQTRTALGGGALVTEAKLNVTGQKKDDTGLLYYHARMYALVIRKAHQTARGKTS